MKVVALQTWSNGTITMDEKSVLDIDDALATDLIAKGIVADAATYFGGGSGGGVLVVTDTDGTLDKTWQEIHDAFVAGSVLIQFGTDTNTLVNVQGVEYHSKSETYTVMPGKCFNWNPDPYTASAASGYPERIE